MNKLACGTLFVGCLAVSFVLLLPKPAISAQRNVATGGCRSTPDGSNVDFMCSLVTDDGYNTGNLSGAYLDFVCPGSGQTVNYQLSKFSYTGSFYVDYGYVACTGVNAQDQWVTASNVKTNASLDDYLEAGIFATSFGYGIEAVY